MRIIASSDQLQYFVDIRSAKLCLQVDHFPPYKTRHVCVPLRDFGKCRCRKQILFEFAGTRAGNTDFTISHEEESNIDCFVG